MAGAAQRVLAQRIPAHLAQLAPGPELSSALSRIDVSRLCHSDLIDVLAAQYRQTNHERAKLMSAMAETGVCDFGPDDQVRRLAGPSSFCADEIRAALVLTRTAAEAGFWLAYDLRHRLPQVFAAMLAGRCDEPRAKVFSDWTAELAPEAARGVCAALLPRAGELTTGQLIEAIKTRAIALDPDWARRRYEHAVAGRKVLARRNHDGSANLCGYDLPVARVALAAARIDSLARAAKVAGDARGMDYIRAQLFLGMTDGSYLGLEDEAILAELAAERLREAGEPAERADAEHGGEHGGEADLAEEAEPSADGDGQQVPADADAGLTAQPCGVAHGSALGCGTDGRSPRREGMQLRACLSTLLALDQRPGELAGWGPIHAELARDVAGSLRAANWRYVLTDEQGYLAHTGLLTARPTIAGGVRAAGQSVRRCDTVELAVRVADLPALAEALADGNHSGWAPVITELVRRAAEHAVETSAHNADVTRRLPSAALRRYLQVRDRRCRGVGCRVPASSADIDHTEDHAAGGPTTAANLGPLCRHDHRLKHEGGWRLDQPEPGLFVWTSRLGQHYEVRQSPVIEALPAPIARAEPLPGMCVPRNYGEDRPIFDDEEPEPERGPPAVVAATELVDIEPPF